MGQRLLLAEWTAEGPNLSKEEEEYSAAAAGERRWPSRNNKGTTRAKDDTL